MRMKGTARETKEYTIDAEGKSLGRTASQAACILMGKNSPSFARNLVPSCAVHVVNASKMKITQKKLHTKVYTRYSGYTGGLKTFSMKKIASDKGYRELFRRAVWRMLPPNKLRRVMIKNLIVN